MVTVPDALGLTPDRARAEIEATGLRCIVEATSTGTTARVQSQEPAAGVSVDLGSVVRIVVSSGP